MAARARLCGVVLAVAVGRAAAAAAGDVAATLRGLLAREGPLVVAGATLEAPLLAAVYAGRRGEPLWVETPERARAAVAVLARAAEHGLEAAAYHVEAIALRLDAESIEARAEAELLLSDAVARWAVHLRAGRVPSAARGPGVGIAPRPVSPVEAVAGVAASTHVGAYLEAFAPRTAAYARLRAALARYRALAAAGGWPAVPDGPKLVPGAVHSSVPALRRRLAATGELTGPSRHATTYDAGLVAAVRRFQVRHGLAADGVVGAGTRAALAADVGRRIEQIGVNLERLRWLPDQAASRSVTVNVAAFTLEAHEGGVRVLAAPVVVGSDEQRTPMLASAITRVVFNPAWTVPDGIARAELLPKAAAEPGYLGRHGFRIYDVDRPGSGPLAVDAAGERTLRARVPRLRLRQGPGPDNPLGRVKFFFPNPFGVFLHDTNSRALLGRRVRTFSHGCVRVGGALALAEWLLRDTPAWPAARRAAVLAGWETTTVTLTEAVPLQLVYLTAWVDDDGGLQFREDHYGRDEPLAAALRRPAAGADARLAVMTASGGPGSPRAEETMIVSPDDGR